MHPPQIPATVKEYASNIPHPVALIGCRSSELSLDCCEYDIAVFGLPKNNAVLQVDGNTFVELLHLTGPLHHHIVDLSGMIVLKDTNKFTLSSAARDLGREKYLKTLFATGKKSLISSLLLQQRMINEANNQIVGAMWLKMAAYEFIGGSLALLGARPMPLHELEQIRQAEADSEMAEGIQIALECIGTERATRPAIARSLEAVYEIKSKDYDRKLVMSKIRHLLDERMLADCYYYAGKAAVKSLVSKDTSFHDRYSKLVQIALDLTSDTQHLDKLQRELFRAANSGLKNC